MKQRGLPGKKIVLQTLDDETNPVNAANAFRKLASDPQTALIYLFINSNSAMAAKSFASCLVSTMRSTRNGFPIRHGTLSTA